MTNAMQDAIEDVRSGGRIDYAAQRHGVSYDTLQRYVRAAGLSRRRRWTDADGREFLACLDQLPLPALEDHLQRPMSAIVSRLRHLGAL